MNEEERIEMNVDDLRKAPTYEAKDLQKEMMKAKDGTTFCVGIKEEDGKKIMVFAEIYHAQYEVIDEETVKIKED